MIQRKEDYTMIATEVFIGKNGEIYLREANFTKTDQTNINSIINFLEELVEGVDDGYYDLQSARKQAIELIEKLKKDS